MLVRCDAGIDSPAAAPVANHNSQQQGDFERKFGSCSSNMTPTAEEAETAVSCDDQLWADGVIHFPSSPASHEEDSSSTSTHEDNGVPGMLSCVSAVAVSCIAPDSNSSQNLLLHAMLVMPLWICLWIIAEETVRKGGSYTAVLLMVSCTDSC